MIRKKNIKKISKISVWLASFIVSAQLCIGMILGYFITKVFAGKEEGSPGRVRSFRFDFKSYRIHFHHWCVALMGMIFFYFADIASPFTYGILGGVMYQGIFSYGDWHKIFIKKDK